MSEQNKITAPSPVQPFSGQGVLRIPPSETSSQAASTGSALGNTGPVHDPLTDHLDPTTSSGTSKRKGPNTLSEKTKTSQRKRKERRINQLLPLESLFQEEVKYPTYFVMKFPGCDIESDLNVISADDEIKNKIGTLKKISKLGKDTLLLITKSKEQSKKATTLKTIDGKPVTVSPHKSMNQIKGTVYSETLGQSTTEQIMEKLQDYGVSNIERMKHRVDGQFTYSNRYIFTFERTTLPRLLKLAEWHHEIVELYIPTPIQCKKCYGLGHTKNWCRCNFEICARCGEGGHRASECLAAASCVNCRGNHPATDRRCPNYMFRCEVLATQTRHH